MITIPPFFIMKIMKSNAFDIGFAFPILMEYLPIQARLALSSTCKFLHTILLQQQMWSHLTISDYQFDWDGQIKWMQKYLSIIKPTQILISVHQNGGDPRLAQLFNEERDFIRSMLVYVDGQKEQIWVLHQNISMHCPLTQLTLSSPCIGDKQLYTMLDNLPKLINLTIQKDDGEITCGELSKCKHIDKLQSLKLIPHQINFSQISTVVKMCNHLTSLDIDVQECNPNILKSMFTNQLPHLKHLHLSHLQQLDDANILFPALSPQINSLILTKAYALPMVSPIILRVASERLLVLQLCECIHLIDQDLQRVAAGCANLRTINVSWCNNVTDNGVGQVIVRCQQLRRVVLTGLKGVTDKCLSTFASLLPFFNQHTYNIIKNSEYCNKEEKHPQDKLGNLFTVASPSPNALDVRELQYLQRLDCVSCNSVSDKLLKLIACLRRRAAIINYYSQQMGIYTPQDDF